MKFRILTLIYFLSLNIYAQKHLDSNLITVEGNSFYSVSSEANKKLIIFLHGGINNPYFEQEVEHVPLNYLLEGNRAFLNQASSKGFNIMVPITNDSLNWLNKPQKSFSILKKMIEQSTVTYEEIYIGGFSDGGTGSFKIFYTYPEYFSGLLVFNGYPQHSNFYKAVNYKAINNKKILFFSSEKDKVIPYEFLLTEYSKQKETNSNTFFYLANGDHTFMSYKEHDLTKVFDILNNKNRNKKTESLQGFIQNDQLITLYPFRKKIVKKYNFGKETYEANLEQHRNYK